ncbi:MAG: helix-turn-helix domain-containing protein [Candidatus Omnitrophica bacterium]|nr:helix-turn-helix domain-containing protein [Candidatus Omnitrophota bacterium]MCA9447352.1 helix-turn-helix domain-containing protein [Candidatus Omnitrophota bacterium]MCB9769062.1 helix-turn-helix domain-containing protein [Candidatus Omnitrophota bacterium]MCB9783349.1 helix-turn-helix domain-containing protein [Candidatus Omnitrophota bacterium]
MEESDIMTVEEVARFLKMKPQTVYKWAQEGQIPGTKLGKEWRFRKSILDEWIDNSIALSKGGFDLMFQQSVLQSNQQSIGKEEINSLLRESME